jgi:hypothetical protein
MEQIPVKFTVSNTGHKQPLTLRLLVDNQCVWESEVIDPQTVEIDVSVEDGDHQLTWKMSGKTTEYTVLDSDNNIVSDACLEFANIEFDGINIDQLVQKLAQYHHNFNGNGDAIQDQFYHSMGCNGTVTLEFSSPFYLWLLEHM